MRIRPAPRYAARRRLTSSSAVHAAVRRSPHADWYSQILPSMLPIAILGSSVYLALHLVQTNLARERYADHAKARIDELEHDLTILRHQSVAHIAPEAPTTRIRRWWLF